MQYLFTTHMQIKHQTDPIIAFNHSLLPQHTIGGEQKGLAARQRAKQAERRSDPKA